MSGAETAHSIKSKPSIQPNGIGQSAIHPDAVAKIRGEYVFGPDERLPGMLWGTTVRSSVASARIASRYIDRARCHDGVHAVLMSEDVPGTQNFGQMVRDQPVLARDVIRYAGEPVAIVAADSLSAARLAARKVQVTYEKTEPITSPEDALAPGSRSLHADGNIIRQLNIRRGEAIPEAPVVVEGEYQTPMQEQFHLAAESALAIPHLDGSLELRVSTQWLHNDHEQIVQCLNIPADKLRVVLSGVGGAFGAREDITTHIHSCMLALRTGRPVKMLYDREESFVAHPKRHPFKIWHTTGVDENGTLLYWSTKMIVDGGAYASATPAVLENAATFACGPYQVPSVSVEAVAAYTNNPLAGAFRGFGAIQACYAYESHMDRVARRLGLDPVEFRLRNVLSDGDKMPTTGQVVPSAPLAEMLTRCRNLPTCVENERAVTRPGSSGGVNRGESLRRGTGYAIGGKMSGFGSGFPESATVRLTLYHDRATIKTAAAELGQGVLSVMAQIARTELGVDSIAFEPFDTDIPTAGSSSSSRSTRMNGGAVALAAEAVRTDLLKRAALKLGSDGDLAIQNGTITSASGHSISLTEVLAGEPISHERTYRPSPTEPLDPVTGQGNNAVAYMFAVHRATVEVDVDLGLARVVDLSTTQDVGRAMNPIAVEGQMEGGSTQGLGYVLMERLVVDKGEIRNPSLTDYLVPTSLDTPEMTLDIMETPLEGSPYGIKGAGEPPIVSSGAAIMNALRAATGYELERIPVQPEDLCGISYEDGQ